MIRKIFILLCTAGGIWGALHLIGRFASQEGEKFTLAGEGVLLAIPVIMVGAVAGFLVGSILYPSRL